jgi:hypothetical protein
MKSYAHPTPDRQAIMMYQRARVPNFFRTHIRTCSVSECMQLKVRLSVGDASARDMTIMRHRLSYTLRDQGRVYLLWERSPCCFHCLIAQAGTLYLKPTLTHNPR